MSWLAAVLGVGLLLVEVGREMRLSPDGQFYLQANPPRPYGIRWGRLGIRLLGEHWKWVTLASLMLAGAGMGSWAGALLLLALPWARTATVLPWLLDAPAMACLVWGMATGNPWVSVLGGLCSEKVPIALAVLTWNPVMLGGLLGPLVGACLAPPPGSQDPEWLQKPFAAAWPKRKRLFQWQHTLLPWGPAALGLLGLTIEGWITLGIAHAQWLMAQDGARLVQAVAAPAMVMAALAVVPGEWHPGLVLVAGMWPGRDRL